jgi:lipopolysaccharide export system permease protein
MKRTLHKYLFHEIWPTFLASLFVAVFIIIATRMLSITELIVNQGGRPGQIGKLVLYLLPDIIAFALPAVSLMAVVIAFLRLSADSEIIALKACGISLYQMMPAVVALSFAAFLCNLIISVYGSPWGNRSFKELLFQLAESKADLGIKERIFCEPFDNVVFYVTSYSSRDKIMRDVFVVDRRDPNVSNTIVAKEARIFMDPREKIITVHFLKGTIFIVEKDLRSGRTIQFNTYDLNIGLKDIMAALEKRRKRPKEMSIHELIQQTRGETPTGVNPHEFLIELLERLSIPLGTFFMGIIGAPLGAQLRARGRTAGIGISLIVFLIYYVCFAAARSVCEAGTIPPQVGVWIPDIFLVLSSSYLLWRVAKERPIDIVPSFFLRLRRGSPRSPLRLL